MRNKRLGPRILVTILLGCLVNDGLGNAEIVILPLIVPPVMSDLLPCRLKQVAAWPRGQVAWNGRFDVNTFGHGYAPPMSWRVDC